MILSFIFFAFLGYLLYKLIADFVLPVYRTTRQVKKTFREMHQKMNGQPNPATAKQPAGSKPEGAFKKPAGDYIDFEEVKE